MKKHIDINFENLCKDAYQIGMDVYNEIKNEERIKFEKKLVISLFKLFYETPNKFFKFNKR